MPRISRAVFDRHLSSNDPGRYNRAFLVIEDQLNLFVFPDEVIRNRPLLLFTESYEQAGEHPYHKKKLIYQFASQRHFAIECANAGFPVCYLTGSDYCDVNVRNLLDTHPGLDISWMQPAEWDTRKRLESLHDIAPDRTSILDNPFILSSPGEGADPFNYLYWNFVNNQRDAFTENGRVSFMVKTWEKFDPGKKDAIIKSSEWFIDELPRYE
ncbi:MAG: cryptochrome/photolyase family protein [Cyclonatronaceae bacterium]